MNTTQPPARENGQSHPSEKKELINAIRGKGIKHNWLSLLFVVFISVQLFYFETTTTTFSYISILFISLLLLFSFQTMQLNKKIETLLDLLREEKIIEFD